MGQRSSALVYFVVLVAVIVGVDVAFLQHHAVTRLVINIALVLAFLSLYWKFLQRS